MRRLAVILFAVSRFPCIAAGQNAPPGTDIYVAPLSWKGGSPSGGPAKNVPGWIAYRHRPFFTPAGRLLFYSSVRPGGPGGSTQSDIYQVSLATGRQQSFTETPESEYSPAIIPGNRGLATIRVELDSTQRLWSFPL